MISKKGTRNLKYRNRKLYGGGKLKYRVFDNDLLKM